MCRIFGFRSIFSSKIHNSLLEAENALAFQSERHPDGWGVCYYLANTPHLVRSIKTAIDDHLFKRVSGVVSSETVVAHLRKATTGDLSIVNAHPFQYGRWVFAHNGNIPDWQKIKPKIITLISEDLRKYILGDTDSEALFYLLITNMRKYGDPLSSTIDSAGLIAAIKETTDQVILLAGPLHKIDDGPSDQHYLTFIITDGQLMAAQQGGKKLFYSTYKKKCPERDQCPYLKDICEAPISGNGEKINHLVISSEPLQGENVWIGLGCRDIVCIDQRLRFTHERGA